MENINYEKLLNNILNAKKIAIIFYDQNLNVLYFSEKAEAIFDKIFINQNVRNIHQNKNVDEYLKVLSDGIVIEKIKKIKKEFYMNTIFPYFDKNGASGIIEILEIKDEDNGLSNEIKKIHIKDYTISEIDSNVKFNNGTIYTLDSIITNDNNMIKLKELALKAADNDSPVLIYGETGTGKELFAQGMHNVSKVRKNNMFVAQNCAAIPETLLESLLFGTTEGSFTGAKDKPGLFEIAEGGTIYLDEINSMALHLQAKLLRVLQDNTYMRIGGKKVKKANVRIIASFNEDPLTVIKKGNFRRDLYYRLNVIYLKIPNLKERINDIYLLTNYFIRIYNKKFNKHILGIDKESMTILSNTNWEGNVRELKNNIERIMNFVEDNYIKIEDISNFLSKEVAIKRECINNEPIDLKNNKDDISFYEDIYKNKTLVEIVEDLEINIIKNSLKETNGNVASAARNLGLPRQTLKNKITKYNIKPIY